MLVMEVTVWLTVELLSSATLGCSTASITHCITISAKMTPSKALLATNRRTDTLTGLSIPKQHRATGAGTVALSAEAIAACVAVSAFPAPCSPLCFSSIGVESGA